MARIVSSRQQGEPGFGTPKSSWPRIRRPLHRILPIKRSMVTGPAIGATSPEAMNLIGGDGVASPGRGGYKGARRILQRPMAPPAPGANERTVRTPGPGRIRRLP
jgi:hypothetical protein